MMLSLSPLALEDTDDYHRLTGDPEVMRYITGRASSPAESRREVERLVARFAGSAGFGIWKATLPDGTFVGVGGLIPDEAEEAAELGFRVLPGYWGQGFGLAIAHELLQRARRQGLRELRATVDEANTASRRILDKLSFEVIGRKSNELGRQDLLLLKKI